MKIMVCASIGYGDINKIRELYSKLSKAGFEVLNHIDEKQMDYSNVKDFREQKELAKKIVEYDLNYLEKADKIIYLPMKGKKESLNVSVPFGVAGYEITKVSH